VTVTIGYTTHKINGSDLTLPILPNSAPSPRHILVSHVSIYTRTYHNLLFTTLNVNMINELFIIQNTFGLSRAFISNHF